MTRLSGWQHEKLRRAGLVCVQKCRVEKEHAAQIAQWVKDAKAKIETILNGGNENAD